MMTINAERMNQLVIRWFFKSIIHIIAFLVLVAIWIGEINFVDWYFSLQKEYVFPTMDSVYYIIPLYCLCIFGTILFKYQRISKIIIGSSYVLSILCIITVFLSYGHVDANGIRYKEAQSFFKEKTILWSQINKNVTIHITQDQSNYRRPDKERALSYTFAIKNGSDELDLFANLTTFRRELVTQLLKTMKDNNIKVNITYGYNIRKDRFNSEDSAFLNKLQELAN